MGPAPKDPGPIPLRPLAVGDLIGGGFAVVRRHLLFLGPIGLLISALSSSALLLTLHLHGSLADFASGEWAEDVLAVFTSGKQPVLPPGTDLALGASSILSVVGVILMCGIVTACAGVDAVGEGKVRGAVRERLRGRTAMMITVGVIVGVLVSIGLTILIAPGVLLFLWWALAAPAAAMEPGQSPGSGPGSFLRRSMQLTRGHRGRMFAVLLLTLLITQAIGTVAGSAGPQLGAVLSGQPLAPVTSLVVAEAGRVLVSAVTVPWVGAVVALFYIDIRVRTENLAPALREYAAQSG